MDRQRLEKDQEELRKQLARRMQQADEMERQIDQTRGALTYIARLLAEPNGQED